MPPVIYRIICRSREINWEQVRIAIDRAQDDLDIGKFAIATFTEGEGGMPITIKRTQTGFTLWVNQY